MKKLKKMALSIGLLILFLIMPLLKINALAADTIVKGIEIGGIDISGKTEEEANSEINSYLDSIKDKEITFEVAQGAKVTTSYGNLGIYWANPEIVKEAVAVANEGNVIERYKIKKDVEVNGLKFDLSIKFDNDKIEAFVNDECRQYDENVANASLTRENGEFIITQGQPGMAVDLEQTKELIAESLYSYYLEGKTEMALPVSMQEPEGTYEQLSMVKDLLGTYTTSYSSSGSNRSANVANGCAKINGTLLYPGEEFSAYKTISPFTEANGYYLAGSYSNGQVVESFGGGICQVSSTLYNAVLLAELDVTERNNHSMIVNYVPKSADAAIAESSGKDFKFVNSTDYPIYIEGYTQDKKITFNIYGVETRPASHSVKYESEVLSETNPPDKIVANSGANIGSFSSSPKHIGYKARLWKIVYENGEEVSRDIVNTSNYSPSAKTVSVGVASSNPEYTSRMMAAIATGDLSTCQATAGAIQAEMQALYDQITAQQAAAQAQQEQPQAE